MAANEEKAICLTSLTDKSNLYKNLSTGNDRKAADSFYYDVESKTTALSGGFNFFVRGNVYIVKWLLTFFIFML